MSPISASVAIYMEDINGHLWHQPLFCPTNETKNSNRANYKEFRDKTHQLLHAHKLRFIHPITKEEIIIESNEFNVDEELSKTIDAKLC